MAKPDSTDLTWISAMLTLAAMYNFVWGVIAAVAPIEMLGWLDVRDVRYPEFWQCLGMLVGLYGAGYWLAATDPVRYWPFVFIGLIGKVLGPVGALVAVISGRLPPAFLWVNVTNDLIWWIPFGWTLWAIRRRTLPEAREQQGRTLYQQVMGPAFDTMTPRLRQFHGAREPVEVGGVFRVTRGDSRFGNWLTDRAAFPRAQEALPVKLAVEPVGGGELWRRSFAGTVVESRQFEARGLLAERFGPLILYLQPRAVNGRLEISDVRSTFWGLPLPLVLAPNVFARGIDSGPGIEVLVRISCPPFGLLVEYRGIVAAVDKAGSAAGA